MNVEQVRDGFEPEWDDQRPWPTLHSAALYGLAGDFVGVVAPQSEADVSALLAQFLVMFGAAVGPSPHIFVESSPHRARLFALLIGATATGRKGTSLDHVRRVFRIADDPWLASAEVGGLASGEALIERLKEREDRPDALRGAFVCEHEFSRLLAVAAREGSVLSEVIRDAWDRDRLCHNVRKGAVTANGVHTGIVAHSTTEELRAKLDGMEIANGFANRFNFVCVKRRQCLPFGGTLSDANFAPIAKRLSAALERARFIGEVRWDDDAREPWETFYRRWPEPEGLVGSLTARAAPQVMRIAMLFALLDGQDRIRLPHLHAAFALWGYCYASTQHVFGSALGDRVADGILAGVREVWPEGMDRDAIRAVFARHVSSDRVTAAIATLAKRNLVRSDTEQTGGRPRITTYAIPRAKSVISAETPSDDPLLALLALTTQG